MVCFDMFRDTLERDFWNMPQHLSFWLGDAWGMWGEWYAEILWGIYRRICGGYAV